MHVWFGCAATSLCKSDLVYFGRGSASGSARKRPFNALMLAIGPLARAINRDGWFWRKTAVT